MSLAPRCWLRSSRAASCGLSPPRKVSERIREIGERVVAEHGEALQILADHDPDAPSGLTRDRGSAGRWGNRSTSRSRTS